MDLLTVDVVELRQWAAEMTEKAHKEVGKPCCTALHCTALHYKKSHNVFLCFDTPYWNNVACCSTDPAKGHSAQ